MNHRAPFYRRFYARINIKQQMFRLYVHSSNVQRGAKALYTKVAIQSISKHKFMKFTYFGIFLFLLLLLVLYSINLKNVEEVRPQTTSFCHKSAFDISTSAKGCKVCPLAENCSRKFSSMTEGFRPLDVFLTCKDILKLLLFLRGVWFMIDELVTCGQGGQSFLIRKQLNNIFF